MPTVVRRLVARLPGRAVRTCAARELPTRPGRTPGHPDHRSSRPARRTGPESARTTSRRPVRRDPAETHPIADTTETVDATAGRVDGQRHRAGLVPTQPRRGVHAAGFSPPSTSRHTTTRPRGVRATPGRADRPSPAGRLDLPDRRGRRAGDRRRPRDGRSTPWCSPRSRPPRPAAPSWKPSETARGRARARVRPASRMPMTPPPTTRPTERGGTPALRRRDRPGCWPAAATPTSARPGPVR